ncbi:MAG: adenosylhomocysteinase [Candidatus Diapherotrites archaeon]|nr:adenosylhomocysteinase [Candidatus Diapherotrites archaeon]
MNKAETGEGRIQYVSKFMPVLSSIKKEYSKRKPFKGIRIAMALHVEPKTAFLVRTLEAGGAKVAITGCNPLSTQDDVVSALKASGTKVYAKYNQTDKGYYNSLHKILDIKPDVVIDDGSDLISLIHKEREELIPNIRGGCEETTTGITRLKAMLKEKKLRFPVIDVNDANTKHLFDNYYGTGESTLTAILSTTNAMISGKNVVVAGYGYCGSGIAAKAKGLGANVIITEVDPVKALRAKMDGFTVMPMKEAAKIADFIITATGMRDIVTKEHFRVMKDKCFLANAGHFNVEINVEQLEEISKSVEQITPDIKQYNLGNKILFLLADGRLVNLASTKGLGHPMEVMDMSFSLQALCAKYVLENKLPIDIIPVPQQIDNKVAKLKLRAMHIRIDNLSKQQKAYKQAWDIGT